MSPPYTINILQYQERKVQGSDFKGEVHTDMCNTIRLERQRGCVVNCGISNKSSQVRYNSRPETRKVKVERIKIKVNAI